MSQKSLATPDTQQSLSIYWRQNPDSSRDRKAMEKKINLKFPPSGVEIVPLFGWKYNALLEGNLAIFTSTSELSSIHMTVIVSLLCVPSR